MHHLPHRSRCRSRQWPLAVLALISIAVAQRPAEAAANIRSRKWSMPVMASSAKRAAHWQR